MSQISKQTSNTVDLSQMSPLKVALAAQRMRPKLSIVSMEPIAVIGMGCCFPGGANDPDTFWQLLRDGIDAISDIPPSRWDVDAYYDPDPDAVGKIYIRHGGFINLLRDFDADFFNREGDAAADEDKDKDELAAIWSEIEDLPDDLVEEMFT